MISVTCRLTAKNQEQLWYPTLGNRVWATFLQSQSKGVDGCLLACHTTEYCQRNRQTVPVRNDWRSLTVASHYNVSGASILCIYYQGYFRHTLFSGHGFLGVSSSNELHFLQRASRWLVSQEHLGSSNASAAFFYIVLLALWRAYVFSSNELPGDEFAVRSVQRVVQRVGQVYRWWRWVQRQLWAVSSTSSGHQPLSPGGRSLPDDQQRGRILLPDCQHHSCSLQRYFLPTRDRFNELGICFWIHVLARNQRNCLMSGCQPTDYCQSCGKSLYNFYDFVVLQNCNYDHAIN